MASKSQRKIEVFGTSIMSSNKIRSNHDKATRILTQAKLTFEFFDIASSEEEKLRYKKLVASNHVKSPELPFIVSGGEAVGTVEQLEEAVEYGELRQFLLLDKRSEDDELLAQLSAAELKELGGDIAAPSHPAAERVANEAQVLSGKGNVEKPIEPAPTPRVSVAVEGKPEIQALDQGQGDVLLSQMIGKDEVQLKKEHDSQILKSNIEAKNTEKDLPSLTNTSINDKIQEKVEKDPTPAVLAE
ncbi:hypothetical protein DFH28DRAFT_135857 [Melampsora americana]|nr:hypothetical protein DFH28DRAFT_135857 [Melampsora americana]